jgi:glycosyltransferase involved in cell wall biosynthesis
MLKQLDISPLVSIIIPTWNSAATLALCLQSIKKQTYKNLEVLIIDGGSTDNTLSVAESYGVKFRKLHKRSRTYQRNLGAFYAKGVLLFFLDSDEVLHPKLVEECVSKYFDGYQGMFVTTIDTGYTYLGKSRCLGNFINLEIKSSAIYIPNSALRFCTKDIFKAVKGQDEDLLIGEDIIFALKCLKSGGKIGRCKYAISHYAVEGLRNILIKKYAYGQTFEKVVEKMGEFNESFRVTHGFGLSAHVLSFRMEYVKMGVFYLVHMFRLKAYSRYIPGFFLVKLIEQCGRVTGYIRSRMFFST